jgi:RimJ/RimL family protein N-acetyltransferase
MTLFPSAWPLPERRAFEGRYVTLAPLDAARDAAGLFSASHGAPEVEALWTYLPYGPFAGEDAMRDWLATAQNGPEPWFFTVTQREFQRLAGSLSIISVAPGDGRAEIGHVWYAPFAQRTRVNTESVFLLLNYLFEELGYRRVEWKCDNRNQASKKAALRLGFQYEGLFRQHRIVKGQNRDTAWFSIIDSEWPRLKDNFQRWLYEDDSVSLAQLNKP